MSCDYKYLLTCSNYLNPIGIYIGFSIGYIYLLLFFYLLSDGIYKYKHKYSRTELIVYIFTLVLMLVCIVLLSITLYYFKTFQRMPDDIDNNEKQKQFEIFNKFGISSISLYIFIFIFFGIIINILFDFIRYEKELKPFFRKYSLNYNKENINYKKKK